MVDLWPQFSLPVTGVPVNSRVSSKIQQLLNTLKRPKRPPLKEFFVDDFEELLEGERSSAGPPVCASRETAGCDDVVITTTEDVEKRGLCPGSGHVCGVTSPSRMTPGTAHTSRS